MADIEIDNIDTKLKTTGTNTNPFSQIGLINTETKKKPHNITIKNNNTNEPKMNINMKYTDKQKYRRYKTKTEPKLHDKIMIDEEDDIVNTIKKAFGIENKKNTNFTNVETSGTPYYEEPNPIPGEQPNIVEMTREPEPAQEEVNMPPLRRKKSKQKESSASTSTEITGEIANPTPISPARLMINNQIKVLEERKKKLEIAQAEAEERAKNEKDRIFKLSMMAMDAGKAAREEEKIQLNLEQKKLYEIPEKDRTKKQIKRLEEISSRLIHISADEYAEHGKKLQEEQQKKDKEEAEIRQKERMKKFYKSAKEMFKENKNEFGRLQKEYPDIKKLSQYDLFLQRANRDKNYLDSGLKYYEIFQQYYPGDYSKLSLDD